MSAEKNLFSSKADLLIIPSGAVQITVHDNETFDAIRQPEQFNKDGRFKRVIDGDTRVVFFLKADLDKLVAEAYKGLAAEADKK